MLLLHCGLPALWACLRCGLPALWLVAARYAECPSPAPQPFPTSDKGNITPSYSSITTRLKSNHSHLTINILFPHIHPYLKLDLRNLQMPEFAGIIAFATLVSLINVFLQDYSSATRYRYWTSQPSASLTFTLRLISFISLILLMSLINPYLFAKKSCPLSRFTTFETALMLITQRMVYCYLPSR